MDWLKQLTDMLGVNPFTFIALSALIIVLIAIARHAIGAAYEKEAWWKSLLSATAIALGIVGAFIFQGAGLYQQDNEFLVIVTGLFNGCFAIASHQMLKQFPWLEKWLKGVVS